MKPKVWVTGAVVNWLLCSPQQQVTYLFIVNTTVYTENSLYMGRLKYIHTEDNEGIGISEPG